MGAQSSCGLPTAFAFLSSPLHVGSLSPKSVSFSPFRASSREVVGVNEEEENSEQGKGNVDPPKS